MTVECEGTLSLSALVNVVNYKTCYVNRSASVSDGLKVQTHLFLFQSLKNPKSDPCPLFVQRLKWIQSDYDFLSTPISTFAYVFLT